MQTARARLDVVGTGQEEDTTLLVVYVNLVSVPNTVPDLR